MTVIGEAFIDVKSRSDGFEQDVTGQVSSIAKKAAAIFAGAFVLEKGVDFFKDVIDQADAARKIMAQTNAVIASTGDVSRVSSTDVTRLATQLSNLSGIEDDTVQTGENMLLTFTNIRNGVGKGNDIFNQATKATLDFSVAMGKDMQSSAILVGKALNDPINGLNALHRVGVAFTDQQKEQIKTMVNAGDTMGAQRLILKELNTEFGGSAAAQATAGAKMQAVLHNLKEELGTRLLPVVDQAATLLGKALPYAFDTLTVGIDTVFAVVGHLGRGLKDLTDLFREAFSFGGSPFGALNTNLSLVEQVTVRIARGFSTAYDSVRLFVGAFTGEGANVGNLSKGWMNGIIDSAVRVRAAWDTVLGGIRALIAAFQAGGSDVTSKGFAGAMERAGLQLREVWNELLPVLQEVWGFVKDHLTPILVGLGLVLLDVATGGIGPLVVALIYAYTHFKLFRDIVDEVGVFLSEHLATILKVTAAVLFGAVGVFIYAYFHFSRFRDIVDEVARVIRDEAIIVFGRLQDMIVAVSALGPRLSEAIGHISVVVRDLAIAIGVVLIPVFLLLRGIWNAVSDDIWNIVQRVWHAIYGVIDNVMRAILDVIKLVLDLINGDWGKAWGDIKDLFGAIWDAIYALLAGALGVIASLLGATLSLLSDVWSAAWRGIKAVLEAVWNEILDGLTAAGTKFMDIMSTALHGVVSFFEALPGQILGAIEALPGLLERAALDMIGSMIAGLLTAVVVVWKFWTDFVPTVLGFLGNAATSLIPKGIDLIIGLGKGITDTAEAVYSWFRALPGTIVAVLGDVGSFLYDQGGDMIRGLGRGITDVAEAVYTWFRNLPGTLVNIVGDVGSTLLDKGHDVLQGLWNGFMDKERELGEWLRALPNRIRDTLGDAYDWLKGVGGDIIHGLIRGIEDTAGDLIDAIKRSVTDKLPGFVKSALHIDSPSKVFADIGRNVVAGMALGLSDTRPIDTAMRGLAVTTPNITLGQVTGGGGVGGGGVTFAAGAIRIEQTFAAGTDTATVDYARSEIAKVLEEVLTKAAVGVGRR